LSGEIIGAMEPRREARGQPARRREAHYGATVHTRAPSDSLSTAQAEPVKGQSLTAVHFGMHTGSPPLRRMHAAVPGHSVELAAGVVHRWEQKRTVRPVAEVFERHRRVSPPQGASREQAR
jgi:hypothetical protein